MSPPPSSGATLLNYALAVFIPPLSVALCGAGLVNVLINVCLWILGLIPGIIHAWWLISKSERNRVVI